jgi:hypothetical protein
MLFTTTKRSRVRPDCTNRVQQPRYATAAPPENLEKSEIRFIEDVLEIPDDDFTSEIVRNVSVIPVDTSALVTPTKNWFTVDSYTHDFQLLKPVWVTQWIAVLLVADKNTSKKHFLADVSEEFVASVKRFKARNGDRRRAIHPI